MPHFYIFFKVTDIGIQNLVFPAFVLRRGMVNLAANRRVKTNALTKYLRVSERGLLESAKL